MLLISTFLSSLLLSSFSHLKYIKCYNSPMWLSKVKVSPLTMCANEVPQ